MTIKYEKRVCDNCGDEYTPKRPDQRFCGPQCRDGWWNKSRPVTRTKPKKEKK